MSVAALILWAAMGAQTQQPATAKPAEKMICKRVYTNDTGSNMRSSKRICGTALDWQLQEEETDRNLRSVERGTYNPNNAPAGMGGSPQ